MKFKTGQEMLEYLQLNGDLYGEKTRCYFFEYNDRGAVCMYHIENDKAKELARKAREDDSYWSGYLGIGGNIYDVPEEAGPQRLDNLEICEMYCQADDWIPTSEYGLEDASKVDLIKNVNINILPSAICVEGGLV